MFGNFIHYIIVLLIYMTHQPPDEISATPLETAILFCGLTMGFSCITWLQFKTFEKQIDKAPPFSLDHKLDMLINRHIILSIMLFAINIYWLNLPVFFSAISFFKTFPTIQAMFFLGLFILYLSIIWASAYGAHEKINRSGLSRRSYIYSNIIFSVPILLPWVVLSTILDIIYALPFEWPQQFLSSAEGQIIYFLTFLFAIAILGPVMIQKFWGCKPLETGFHRSRIEAFCQKANVKCADILLWPLFGGKMITAAVMGLIHQFRYILVTPSLLRFLEPEEVDAVIAHEIGHVKKHHLQFYLFFFAGYLLISYAAFNLITILIFYSESAYDLVESLGINYPAFASPVLSLFVIMIFVIYFRYIFGYFMRNFERQADIYVYSFFNTARPLINTFRKITAVTGQTPDKPNWHHFSITERIGYLEQCEADKKWITRHDRKIKKSIAIYLVCIILIGLIGLNLNFGETGKNLNKSLMKKFVLREINKGAKNPSLYQLLGDIYVNEKNYPEAIQAYSSALTLKPNSPETLNNLAWLYATCENKTLRDPSAALALAQKAARLKPAPYILDTLAESYYANSMYEEAIAIEKRVLKMVKTDREIFEKQLDKFVKAAQHERGI